MVNIDEMRVKCRWFVTALPRAALVVAFVFILLLVLSFYVLCERASVPQFFLAVSTFKFFSLVKLQLVIP